MINEALAKAGITLDELAAEYIIKEVNLEFGKQKLKIIKVADLDELLDRVVNEDEIPFWAELWPASIGMSKFILENKAIFDGKKVLELGAGVGLVGIAARLAGAKVVQSDFNSEALRFIRYNTQCNHLSEPELLLADWRDFPITTPTYDLILGSDILYEKNLHLSLAKIFSQALKPGGAVWLGDPGRAYAKQFCELTVFEAWQIGSEQILTSYEGKSFQIDLYRLEFPGN